MACGHGIPSGTEPELAIRMQVAVTSSCVHRLIALAHIAEVLSIRRAIQPVQDDRGMEKRWLKRKADKETPIPERSRLLSIGQLPSLARAGGPRDRPLKRVHIEC